MLKHEACPNIVLRQAHPFIFAYSWHDRMVHSYSDGDGTQRHFFIMIAILVPEVTVRGSQILTSVTAGRHFEKIR